MIIKKAFSSGNVLLNQKVSPSEVLKNYLEEKSILSIVIGSINNSHLRQNIEPLQKK